MSYLPQGVPGFVLAEIPRYLLIVQTSTTYNSFMYLSLPLATGRSSKVTLTQCLDAFVKSEVMEKTDAWCVASITRLGLRLIVWLQALSKLQRPQKSDETIIIVSPAACATYPSQTIPSERTIHR